jgi:hypothetical protein
MFPEDRVLVGVINRKRDFVTARDAAWYRVPQAQMPRGVFAEYIGFYLSGAFGERNGGIHYYAERKGLELAYRRDLLPKEPNHKRANEVYYRVGLGELVEKIPPVLNPTHRPVSFIHTTWDRFVHAQQISDLYSTADYYVDRIFHALRQVGVYPERFWDAERRTTGTAAGLRILCQGGTVTALTERTDGTLYLDVAQDDDAILNSIRAAIAACGGAVTVGIPSEGN